jgi:hypothetical protein
MLEAAAISILVKAADFLFEEGRKILQERRERRQAQPQEALPTASTPAPAAEATSAEVIGSKEDLLRQEISETAWATHEKEVRHLVALFEVHMRNYHLAQEQYAKWGSALVPQIVVHNLEESEDAVADTMRRLQTLLNGLYGKTIVVPELET